MAELGVRPLLHCGVCVAVITFAMSTLRVSSSSLSTRVYCHHRYGQRQHYQTGEHMSEDDVVFHLLSSHLTIWYGAVWCHAICDAV